MSNLIVVGPRTNKKSYENYRVVNTTSSSLTRSKELSPFYVGPINLWGDNISLNMENAWQYSKVYEGYCNDNGPIDKFFEWAKKGWAKKSADRYPMGKGANPKYSYWELDGKPIHLEYIAARKMIYTPLYSEAVKKTEAFSILEKIYKKGDLLALWDYDGYNHYDFGFSLNEVANTTKFKMGHAFVLFALLKNQMKDIE